MGKPTRLFSGRNRLVWLVVVLFAVPFGSSSTEAACGESPAITTDKLDYSPIETVVISGTGFNCGEVLSVLITAPDGSTMSGDGTGAAGPDSVAADDNGAFALRYHLSGTLADSSAYQGQLGIYRVDVLDVSATVLAETHFGDAGGAFSCALTTAGGVKCWGYGGGWGSLGNASVENSATPVDVTGLTRGVVQIAVGIAHACALTTAGGVKCWGANVYGALGNGTFASTYPLGTATPGDVIGLTSDVAQISAGYFYTCAVTTSGGAKCWGNGGAGNLGNGASGFSATPVDVSTLTSGVVQISAGGDHTCAVTTSGQAKCWGSNSYGQLGDGTFTTTYPFGIATPVDVSTLTNGVLQIRSGNGHTCAITTAGGVKCWGANSRGQLGNGTFMTSATPVDVSTLTTGVAALWDGEPRVPWTFSGFYRPVEMGGARNTVKNGSTVPIKFEVFAASTELTDPAIVIQPLTATQTPCSGGPTDNIELTATAETSLRYDAASGYFIYNWKTPRMPGYCYTTTVTLTDGTSHIANFQLR